jgi:hypothetical protein
MVQCCSKGLCNYHLLPVYPLKHACAKCKLGLHAICAAYEIDDAPAPHDNVCLTCAPLPIPAPATTNLECEFWISVGKLDKEQEILF